MNNLITYSEFSKLDIRVGTIISAELKVPTEVPTQPSSVSGERTALTQER